MTRPATLAATLAVAALAGGCSDDSVYSGGGGDPRARAAAERVVLRNLTALERGDGRTYCSTYTRKFLRTYHDGFAKCMAGFRRPRPSAPPPRVRFTDLLTATERRVAVEFTVDGGSTQTYFMNHEKPVPQVGTTPRWLIDLETVERD